MTVRRRAKPSVFAALRVFWIFIAVLLAFGAYAGYRIATWPEFFPKSISVVGAAHVQSADILRRAAIPSDRNVWLIDKHAAEGRIEALPWIRSAAIHRTPPANVRIVITERIPAACVASGTERYLVDADAHLIETTCAAARVVQIAWPQLQPQHPGAVLDQTLLTRFLRDENALRAAHLQPALLGFDRFGGLEATLGSGLRLRLGDDKDVAQKAALVDPILRAYGKGIGHVAVIDLRAPSTPVVEERSPHK
jgi:cell division septal protein FtsQ